MTYPTWSFLKPGDTIGIIAPGSAGFEADLFQKAETKLRAAGFEPRLLPHLPNQDPFSLYTPKERTDYILGMLQNGCKALWAMRGGYGTAQLLPLLDQHLPTLKQLSPIPLVGFSDVTALHHWWQQQLGWPSLHGAVLKTLADDRSDAENRQEHFDQLLAILTGKQTKITYTDLAPLNQKAHHETAIEGTLVGGNLCVVASLIGTPWQLHTSNHILFLEDVDERGYRLDRMFWQLEQSHMLQSVKSVILGDFIGGKEADGSSLIDIALERAAVRFEALGIPTFRLPYCGHDRMNRPLALGTPTQIQGTHLIQLSGGK